MRKLVFALFLAVISVGLANNVQAQMKNDNPMVGGAAM